MFFDNDEKKHNTMLYGIPIKKWNSLSKYKIVIASGFWKEISQQLTNAGLRPFSDFEIDKHFMGSISYDEIYTLKR